MLVTFSSQRVKSFLSSQSFALFSQLYSRFDPAVILLGKIRSWLWSSSTWWHLVPNFCLWAT